MNKNSKINLLCSLQILHNRAVESYLCILFLLLGVGHLKRMALEFFVVNFWMLMTKVGHNRINFGDMNQILGDILSKF